MLLTERINESFQIVESNRENLPSGVLCRVKYPICNIGQLNANKRRYGKDLWERVRSNEVVSEQMRNRALFGHAEHPSASQSDLQLTSHVIFEMIIDEKENRVYQMLDVLDTPTGRIVDCLLRAGCKVGVSTRAEGELQEAKDDQGNKCYDVIPDKYRYITTDFTADPSTFGAIPIDIKRNVVERVNKEILNEKAKAGEKSYAVGVLESMSCQGKDPKQECKCGANGCGACKILSEKTITVTVSPDSNSASIAGDVNTVNVTPVPTNGQSAENTPVTVVVTTPENIPVVQPEVVEEPKDEYDMEGELNFGEPKDPEITDDEAEELEDEEEDEGELGESKKVNECDAESLESYKDEEGDTVFVLPNVEFTKDIATTVKNAVKAGYADFLHTELGSGQGIANKDRSKVYWGADVQDHLSDEDWDIDESKKVNESGPYYPNKDDWDNKFWNNNYKVIVTEHGIEFMVNADHEQDAIDYIIDYCRDNLPGLLLTDEEVEEAEKDGTIEEYIYGGNEGRYLNTSAIRFERVNANESKVFLNESEDIKKLYKNAGLPAPKGKGEHTMAFHKKAIAVAKSYVKKGDSPKAALKKAYPTAMKQLGKAKSVRKTHRKNENKVNEAVEIYTQEQYDSELQSGPIIPDNSSRTYQVPDSFDLDRFIGIIGPPTRSEEESIDWVGEIDGEQFRMILTQSDELFSIVAKDVSTVDTVEEWLGLETQWDMAPTKDKNESKSVVERTTPKIGDVVQIKDKEGNTTIVPSAKVELFDTTEPDGKITIKVEGHDEQFNEEDYTFVILDPVEESSKSVLGFAKKINDLRVKEAAVRAERDRLMEEINKTESNVLQCKMLKTRMKSILETKTSEVDAVCTMLEAKDSKNAELQKQIDEAREELSKSLKLIERITADSEKQIKESESRIKSIKDECDKIVKERVNEATRSVVRDYAAGQVKMFESVQDNVRALLEDCMTIHEVDGILDEYRASKRRGALHQRPKKIDEKIVTERVEPKSDGTKDRVGLVFEGLGM